MRLIDADALKEHFKEYTTHSGIQASLDRYAFKVIEEQPTVNALHVINCRECRWLKTNEFYTYCPITKHYGLDSNTYCCWAERKDHE